MTILRRAWPAAVALALTSVQQTPAGAEPGDAVRVSGAVSVLGWRTKDPSGDVLGTTLARLRLEFAGTGPSGLGGPSWNVVYDNEIVAGGLVKTPAFAALAATPEPTAVDLHGQAAAGGAYRWTHRLARASLAWQTSGGRVILGRQRIGWGSGRIWRPTDRFNPAAPTTIDAGEKTGVDALFAERYAGPFGAWQFAAAPGNMSRNVVRKLAVRWRDTVGETDYAVMAARIGGETVAGLDLAANIGDGLLYLEAAAGRPREEPDYMQLSLGFETALAPDFLSGPVTLGIEALRNTAATGDDTALPATDRLRTRRGQHLALSASYGLGFTGQLSLVVLLDVETGSRALLPSATWAAAQNLDVSLSAQVFSGGPRSEYGNSANVLAVRLAAYF